MKNPQIMAILAIALAIIPLPLTAQQPTSIAIARQFYHWNINSVGILPDPLLGRAISF